jgi:glutamate synthase (NADPH/NADH) small chain
MSEYLKAERAVAWREELRKSMKNKDRIAIPRVVMPEVDPDIRSHNYDEVNLGLTEEMAVKESHRCLDCVDPTCISGCPVEINIPKFIKNIERGEFLEAAKTLKETSALPAVCGRVCPQERQCENSCFYTQKLKKEPVAIGHLERFAADFERNSGNISIPEIAPSNGIKVAAIGSGPAGLAFASIRFTLVRYSLQDIIPIRFSPGIFIKLGKPAPLPTNIPLKPASFRSS